MYRSIILFSKFIGFFCYISAIAGATQFLEWMLGTTSRPSSGILTISAISIVCGWVFFSFVPSRLRIRLPILPQQYIAFREHDKKWGKILVVTSVVIFVLGVGGTLFDFLIHIDGGSTLFSSDTMMYIATISMVVSVSFLALGTALRSRS